MLYRDISLVSIFGLRGTLYVQRVEVENTICRHPAVLECAVVAVPDEKWGERPKAFVKLGAGLTATERQIIDFCRQNLPHFKAPASVEFTDLPKTSTGKVQKYLLRGKGLGRARKARQLTQPEELNLCPSPLTTLGRFAK